MDAPKGRLALAIAALGFILAVAGRAQAGGIALNTPAGLTPGESFRFVFVTDDSMPATSSNIADYNSFVNAEAGGATYNGALITWSAIASTTAVSAIDNIGQAPITGVYLANGTLVTTSTTTSGLWSGSLLNPIDMDLSGNMANVFVWTGTLFDGTTTSGVPLGNSSGFAGFGSDSTASSNWVFEDLVQTPTSLDLYGISQVLPVAGVPEPSTLFMAGMAIIAGLACARPRICRSGFPA
jgi:PEP-CTERM motif